MTDTNPAVPMVRREGRAGAKTMRLASLLGGLALASLTGCMSVERELASDRAQCQAQGLSPDSKAFDDCLAVARDRHRDVSERMQYAVDRNMSDFMHSGSFNP
jgi:hypothetical protein